MYNNSYSRPKVALEKKVIHKPKGKSCGYYLRIVFFFSSLIQSLIIISLVLFLVYGQPGKTPDEMRVEELEQGFNKLSTDNTKLRKEKAELTSLLKTKTAGKDAADKKVEKLTAELESAKSNNTKLLQSLASCNANKVPQSRLAAPVQCPPVVNTNAHMKTILDHQKALYLNLQSNFSHTVQNLKFDLERLAKEKSKHELAATQLKQEKEDLNAELQLYKKKCKEDFMSALQGIQTVTNSFLTKIDNLFPDSFTFHLTCDRQQEHMTRIKDKCTNLSREVENKFQSYLNFVGNRVSDLHSSSSHLEVQNRRLTSDFQQCSQSRTQETEQCKKLLAEAQETQDRLVEPLLQAQNQLMQEKQMLQAMCAPKPVLPSLPRSSGLDSPLAFDHQSRPGLSSAGQSRSGLSSGGLSIPGLSSGGLSSPGLSSAGQSRSGLSSGGLSSPGLSSGGLSSPGLSSAGQSRSGLSSGGLSSPGMSSGGLSSPGLSSAGQSRSGLNSGGLSSPGISSG